MADKSTTSGKFHVLLPERTSLADGDRPCAWPAALEGGLVGISKAQLSTNLVWTGAIDPRGISHPWSAAWAFEYKLAAGDPGTAELLRLVLMARFANAVKEVARRIRQDGTPLERVLHASLPDPDGRSDRTIKTLEWHQPVGRISPVLAASMAPRWYLYPATAYQSPEGLKELQKVLLGGKNANLLIDFIEEPGSRRIQIADTELRKRFHEIMLGLGEHENRTVAPLKDWLLAAARNELSPGAHGMFHNELNGVFPTCYHGAAWQCSQHGSGDPWGQDSGMPVCVLDNMHTHVKCTRHNSAVQIDGKAVTVEALGAAVLCRPDGADELVVWTDTKRDDNIVVVNEMASGYLLQYGQGPKIELRGRKLALRDIECPWNAIPPLPGAGAADRTIPVRSEFLDLIEEPPVWNGARRKWLVKLRGRPEATEFPLGTDDPAASVDLGSLSGLLVWPAQALEGWDFDVIGAHLQYGADEIAVAYRGDDARLQLTPFKSNLLIETTPRGAAEYVVTRAKGVERGAIRFGRSRVERPKSSERGLIAIDFGTSNTSVRFKIKGRNESGADEHEYRVFNGHRSGAVAPGCHIEAAHANFQKTLIGAQRIFSEWYSTPRPTPLLSTLLWTLADNSRNRIMSSIVPRDPAVMYALSTSSQQVSQKIHADLKWHGLGSYDQDALNTYLTRALAPAFYELARRGVNLVTVAASYPLAFDPERKNDFTVAMTRAVTEMATAAGMKPHDNPLDIRFYSESLAGTRDIAAENARYKITIDLGGGTTDLAVLGPTPGDPNAPLKCLAADSLEIGARKIIAALCRDIPEEDLQRRLYKALEDADEARQPSAKADAKLPVESIPLAFESLLQESYVDKLCGNLATCIGVTNRAAVAALLAGIVVASDRMLKIVLAGNASTAPKVQVVFLGQGWHLLRSGLLRQHFSESGFVSAMTKAGCGKYELLPSSVAGGDDLPLQRKLQVVNGAMRLLEIGHSSDENETVTYVGMDLSLANAGVLSQGEQVRDAEVTAFADGDPGFGALIAELTDVARQLSPRNPDVIKEWLEVKHADSDSRGQLLVREGCGVLNRLLGRHELSAHKQRLTSSPLSKFISGPWADIWIRRQVSR